MQESKAWTPDDLRELRKAKGWTQSRAAAEIGVTQGTWSNWEREEGFPPPLSKRKLLDVIAATGLVSAKV